MIESSTQKYRILFKGEIEEGQELETVKSRLAQLFKISPERIEKLFTGKTITLNHNIELAKAQEYSDTLKNAGAICIIEPMAEVFLAPLNNNGQTSQTVPQKINTSTSKVVSSKIDSLMKAIKSSSLHSNSFLSGWILATSGMILLPIFYLFLILFIANTTLNHIEDNITFLDDYSLVLGILLYIIPMFAGIVLIAAMIKPLIARPSAKKLSLPLSRKKESVLYAFIEKLCRAIGSKIPTNIEVNCSINTSTYYRRWLVGFLEDDLTLTIGLPLISEMTITEFANLLALEFCRHTQKIEMRLSYIITSINLWFTRVVYEQDIVDDKLDLMLLTSSNLISQIPLYIFKFFIWISRKILTVFLLAGLLISKAFVRRIEIEADNCSVRIAGFESFKSALTKLRSLTGSSVEAYSQLKKQKSPNDNSLPDDFVLLISSINHQLPDKDIMKTKNESLQEKTALDTAYPFEERMENVKKLISRNLFKSDKSASTLFANFEELTKIASVKLYREVLGLRFDIDDLVPTAQFFKNSNPEPTTSEIDSNFF